MTNKTKKDPAEILLYIPNIIGYFRVILIIFASLSVDSPGLFLCFYALSASLDFVDGWAARALQQQSSFGAWLDVIVDNLSRTLLWTHSVRWGWLVASIEWITFVCNHQGGSKWREMYEKTLEKKDNPAKMELRVPGFVQKVMAHGFKTRYGTFAIMGIHVLPIWLYMMQTQFLDQFLHFIFTYFICAFLLGGRLLGLAVEFWCIYKHVLELLWENQI